MYARAGEKLASLERLDEVIVDASFESLGPCFGASLCRDHDDRDEGRLRIPSERRGQLLTRDERHHRVRLPKRNMHVSRQVLSRRF